MPTTTSVHTNAPLTNLAIAYPTQSWIGPRLLPDLPVQKRSDLYYIFDATQRAKAEVDDRRAPGTKAREVDFAITSSSYICDGHALKHIVPDEERENADAPIAPMQDATEFLVDRVLVTQEIDCASVLSAGVSGSDPTHEWDDYTNGDPVADMKLAFDTVEDACGFTPNVVSMDSKVWRAVKNHPDIVDRVKYTGTNNTPGDVTVQGFADLFDLEEVIIGNSMKNTAVEGQSASTSRIWGSDVYVAYRPARPGLKIPALGYRIVWAPFTGGLDGWRVKTWRDDERGGDMVQVEKYYVHKLTLASAAYKLQNRLT